MKGIKNMEINKQLFEDILSGKLKGKFVLRNGDIYFSVGLCRNKYKFRFTHPYIIGFGSYTPKGLFSIGDTTSSFDIIDFIPDTDMKQNELMIEIPNDKIVDWDESKKQNKIVLKNKRLTYNDIIKHAEIGSISNIHYFSDDQMKCLLAKNRLANVAKYLNGEWKPDASYDIAMITVNHCDSDNVVVVSVMNGSIASNCGSIWFKTEELAQQAIEILGEKTVKLALEPLGI